MHPHAQRRQQDVQLNARLLGPLPLSRCRASWTRPMPSAVPAPGPSFPLPAFLPPSTLSPRSYALTGLSQIKLGVAPLYVPCNLIPDPATHHSGAHRGTRVVIHWAKGITSGVLSLESPTHAHTTLTVSTLDPTHHIQPLQLWSKRARTLVRLARCYFNNPPTPPHSPHPPHLLMPDHHELRYHLRPRRFRAHCRCRPCAGRRGPAVRPHRPVLRSPRW